MNKDTQTLAVVIAGEGLVAAVSDLINCSCWFEVTPLPNNEWVVRVKDEPGARKILGEAHIYFRTK